MWMKLLIELLASNLTKEVVSAILDKIAESVKNKTTQSDVDKLKEVL